VLFYDREHLNDEYGGLGDQPLDPDEFEEFRISAGEFEFEWTAQKAMNRA
jgi:hypothetical protein